MVVLIAQPRAEFWRRTIDVNLLVKVFEPTSA